ncbi:MAG: glycosyltransferase [Fibrobacterota bacterium]
MNELSVIILNHNEKEAVLKSLSSFVPVCGGAEFIVFDNGSGDGSAKEIKRRYPEVKVIESPENLGISVARNRAVNEAGGSFILSLDSDTEYLSGDINGAVSYLKHNSGIGIAGFRLFGTDGAVQSSCRRFPSFYIPVLSRIAPLRRIKSLRQKFERHLMTDFDHTVIRDVDYVLGACQFFKKDVFLEVGGYDENIFFGPEDIDLALRLRKKGFRNIYYPRVEIKHSHRRRTKNYFSKVVFMHLKGLARYFMKHGLFNKI